MRGIVFSFFLLTLMVQSLWAKESGGPAFDTLWIKTSAQCEICKETIEKALAYERGVLASDLNLQTKLVKVIYNPLKTTPEKIRKAISMSGYDADQVLADPRAYKRLPKCCKKPQDR